MATFRFDGLDEYEMLLSKISQKENIRAVCGATIYAGADVVADSIRAGIDSLPVVDHRQHGTSDNQLQGITSAQKKGLIDGFGITPMSENNGYYDVKLGFDGYNSVKTEAYPQGQPNALIARSVNSGTSFRAKTRFVDKATKAAKAPAEKAMVEAFDRKFEEILK